MVQARTPSVLELDQVEQVQRTYSVMSRLIIAWAKENGHEYLVPRAINALLSAQGCTG